MYLCDDIGCGIDYVQNIVDEFSFDVQIMPEAYGMVVYNRSTNLGTQKMTNSPLGLVITSDKPAGRICGATYPYGSVTIYWTQEDIDRTGELAEAVFKLRVIHELLHHFNKPADNIRDWLADKPILEYLFYDVANGSGETPIGVAIQELFYRDLCKDIHEEEFNVEYNMGRRMSNGLLL